MLVGNKFFYNFELELTLILEIFDTKIPIPDIVEKESIQPQPRLSENTPQERSERTKRLIFSEIDNNKPKQIENLLDTMEENLETGLDDEGINKARVLHIVKTAPGEKLGELNKERHSSINDFELPSKREEEEKMIMRDAPSDSNLEDVMLGSERFPFELKHGVLEGGESFFDFDNDSKASRSEFRVLSHILASFV